MTTKLEGVALVVGPLVEEHFLAASLTFSNTVFKLLLYEKGQAFLDTQYSIISGKNKLGKNGLHCVSKMAIAISMYRVAIL